MMTGAWLSTAAVGLPWLTQAVAAPGTLALVDTSLGDGRAFARDAARRGSSIFDISLESGADIGMLWHTTLAPRLAAAPGFVVGLARASDYFVLGQLASRSGRMAEHQCERCSGLHAPVAFLLGPSAGRGRLA
jgi:hypothetical protein